MPIHHDEPYRRAIAAALAALAIGYVTPASADASDEDVERAREACEAVAERRDWNDIETNVEDDSSDDRVIIRVSGRRDGEDRERECRYDVDDREAQIEDN